MLEVAGRTAPKWLLSPIAVSLRRRHATLSAVLGYVSCVPHAITPSVFKRPRTGPLEDTLEAV